MSRSGVWEQFIILAFNKIIVREFNPFTAIHEYIQGRNVICFSYNSISGLRYVTDLEESDEDFCSDAVGSGISDTDNAQTEKRKI